MTVIEEEEERTAQTVAHLSLEGRKEKEVVVVAHVLTASLKAVMMMFVSNNNTTGYVLVHLYNY